MPLAQRFLPDFQALLEERLRLLKVAVSQVERG
jgi:hypothetical protein